MRHIALEGREDPLTFPFISVTKKKTASPTNARLLITDTPASTWLLTRKRALEEDDNLKKEKKSKTKKAAVSDGTKAPGTAEYFCSI